MIYAQMLLREQLKTRTYLPTFKFFFFCIFLVPVCMPADGTDFTGRMATVSGWGRLKYGGGVPSVFQEVQVCTFLILLDLRFIQIRL